MNTNEKISNTHLRVGLVLARYPKTRNSDKELIVRYIEQFHPEIIYFGDILENENVPSFETITRSRRDYQSDGLYCANTAVEDERLENQVEFADFFGGR